MNKAQWNITQFMKYVKLNCALLLVRSYKVLVSAMTIWQPFHPTTGQQMHQPKEQGRADSTSLPGRQATVRVTIMLSNPGKTAGSLACRKAVASGGTWAWVVGAIAAAGLLWAPTPAQAWRLNRPALTCANATQASIEVKICAGPTGAPNGFALKWAQGDPGTSWTLLSPKCTASFFNKALGYNLGPNQCVTVSIGELLDSEASSIDPSCAIALQCGKSYAFKGYARGSTTKLRSYDFGPKYCSTLKCTPSDTCTFTQGYWKTHGPIPKGNNEYVWPKEVKDNGLRLGNVLYTADQLLLIFNEQPKKGNGLVSLAHQLIAAKLNVLNGSDPTDVANSIAAADALIGALTVPPVGTGFKAASETSASTEALADYNEGKTGPGHCG
jgi:hypothetical protein